MRGLSPVIMMHWMGGPRMEVSRAGKAESEVGQKKRKDTYPMRRIRQHLQALHRVRLEGTMENQETSKHEPALDFVARELVDLSTPR